jgi:hypothetical protein
VQFLSAFVAGTLKTQKAGGKLVHTDAPFVNVNVSFRGDRGGSSSRAAGALVFGHAVGL